MGNLANDTRPDNKLNNVMISWKPLVSSLSLLSCQETVSVPVTHVIWLYMFCKDQAPYRNMMPPLDIQR